MNVYDDVQPTLNEFSSHTPRKPIALVETTQNSTSNTRFSQVPNSLVEIPNWVLWKFEARKDKQGNVVSDKLSKPPYQTNGEHASTKDPSTWCTFEQAVQTLNTCNNRYNGIGFVVKGQINNQEIIGFDVDHPFDSELSQEFIAHFKTTYCERSPSNNLRIFCIGSIPRSGKGTVDKKIEVYDRNSPRYLTVTGNHIDGTGLTVEPCQDALDWVFNRFFSKNQDNPLPLPQNPSKKQTVNNNNVHSDVVLSDEQIIELCRRAKNSAKFESLFNGGGNKDESSGDMALAGILAFYCASSTGQGQNQIDRIMRLSSRNNLKNGKWDAKHCADGRTYGQMTIEEAIVNLKDTYKSGSKTNKVTSKSDNASKSGVTCFWDVDDKGKLQLNPSDYVNLLNQNGFCKVIPEHEKGVIPDGILCRNTQNRLSQINTYVIAKFITDLVKDDKKVLNAVLDKTNKLFNVENWLVGLNTVEKPFHKDTKTSSFVYYRNCYVEVTTNSITSHDYSELDGIIWQDNVLDRDFSILPKESFINCEFGRFQYHNCLSNRNPTEEDKELAKNRLRSLRSGIGYLMHRYKDASEIRAVIFNDEKISEEGNEGRTGKGINMHAVSYIRTVTWLDGKTFKFDDRNRFQSLTPATDVVCYDDVGKKFVLELLFSVLAEGYTKENKFKDAVKLLQAIKSALTTNHVISGDSASDIGRKFELEISPYYDVDFSPKDEFGHCFFDDWSKEEWLKFDNYMLYCLQFFLQNGLVESKPINLIERKLIQDTKPEFIEFADSLERDIRHDKKVKFGEFITEYPDFGNSYGSIKQRTFSAYLRKYAKARGLGFKGDDKSNGNNFFTFVTKSTNNVVEQSVTTKEESSPVIDYSTNLTPGEQKVLDLLQDSKGKTPHDIAIALKIDFEIAVNIRKTLQKKGYLKEVTEKQLDYAFIELKK